jgi:hypothetical protein
VKSIIPGLLALTALAMPARAQPIFPLGVPLPPMVLRICSSPEAALAQSKLSENLGRDAFSKERIYSEKHKDCLLSMVEATPKQRVLEVPSYVTWMITYSAGSTSSFGAQHNGKTYTVPYSFALQRTSWYFAELRSDKNQTFRAWVEIPDKPYMFDYLLNRP